MRSSQDPGETREKPIGLGERSAGEGYYGPESEARLLELERFRALLDHGRDVVVLIDAAAGKVADANLAACRLLGISRPALLGRKPEDILACPPESGLAALWSGPPPPPPADEWRGACRLLPQGGESLPVEVIAHRASFRDRSFVVLLARDVGQRFRQEEALREREAKLASILRSAPVGIGVLMGRVFSEVNPRLCEMTGYLREELVGQSSSLLYEDAWEFERVGREEYRQMAGGDTGSVTTRWRRKDGTLLDISLSATAIEPGHPEAGVTLIAQDTTAARRAAAALHESEERHRTLVEESFDGIYLQKGTGIAFANARLHQMLGYRPGELIGLAHYTIFHPDDQELIRQRAQARLRGEEVASRYEIRARRWDGQTFEAEISAKRILADGAPAIQVWMRDITDLKRAERERGALEEQLRQAQKMEALGTLASGIAHDFNNLLNAILGFAELAQQAEEEGRACPRELGQVIAAAQRAGDLVKSILTFGRKSPPRLKPLDLNREIRRTVAILERTLPKTVSVATRLAPGLSPVNADPNQLEQVLINLSTNAADAMPEGGTLAFATRGGLGTEVGEALPPGLPPGDYLLLEVSDTGTGMSRQIQNQIFDPFFTTKEPGKGTGLGLSLVYGIVKSHGGEVVCRSRPGRGTTFLVYLPALGEATAGSEETVFAEAWPAGRGETVLLADDEEALRGMATYALEANGYRVAAASSGEEALALYRATTPRPDLVVLDLGMPGMGGRRCLRELLALDPRARVLIVSGYQEEDQVQAAREWGAAGFLAKPFRLGELLARVRGVLDHPAPPSR